LIYSSLPFHQGGREIFGVGEGDSSTAFSLGRGEKGRKEGGKERTIIYFICLGREKEGEKGGGKRLKKKGGGKRPLYCLASQRGGKKGRGAIGGSFLF